MFVQKNVFVSNKVYYNRLLIEFDKGRCTTATADSNEDEYEKCMQRENSINAESNRFASILNDNTRKIFEMNTNISAENRSTLLNILSQIVLPATDDVSSAIIALIRIQITYKLATDQFANGIIVGKKIAKPLNGTGKRKYTRNRYMSSNLVLNNVLI